MHRTRISYGGPIDDHWSWAWMRWMSTVWGLCVFTAAMSVLAVYSSWQRGIDVVDLARVLLPALGIVNIARHLKTREREPERTTPDASMRALWEVAWVLVLMILLASFTAA